MLRRMNIAVSMVVLSIGILACQGGGGKKNQRDSKLDAQQQKIEQALHDVESRVGQVVQQAQERYDGVVRSAQQVKRDLGTRADQVDRAAQGMVQQAQKLEQMANTAADKAQSMVGAVETAWGDFQVRRETTPASPR